MATKKTSKTKSRTYKSKLSRKKHIPKWAIIAGIAVIVIVGIALIYNSFACSKKDTACINAQLKKLAKQQQDQKTPSITKEAPKTIGKSSTSSDNTKSPSGFKKVNDPSPDDLRNAYLQNGGNALKNVQGAKKATIYCNQGLCSATRFPGSSPQKAAVGTVSKETCSDGQAYIVNVNKRAKPGCLVTVN